VPLNNSLKEDFCPQVDAVLLTPQPPQGGEALREGWGTRWERTPVYDLSAT